MVNPVEFLVFDMQRWHLCFVQIVGVAVLRVFDIEIEGLFSISSFN